jgi:uncharacterized membrane protein
MTIDTRFAIAIAIMAAVAYGCRAAGLMVGTHLGERRNLKRILDVLPACAMGAVLGPSLVAMTPVQAIAVAASTLVYFASLRFLLALAAGTAVLLCERWILPSLT